jgi:hypothetical protein
MEELKRLRLVCLACFVGTEPGDLMLCALRVDRSRSRGIRATQCRKAPPLRVSLLPHTGHFDVDLAGIRPRIHLIIIIAMFKFTWMVGGRSIGTPRSLACCSARQRTDLTSSRRTTWAELRDFLGRAPVGCCLSLSE